MQAIYNPTTTADPILLCDDCANTAPEWAGLENNAPSRLLADPQEGWRIGWPDAAERLADLRHPCARCGRWDDDAPQEAISDADNAGLPTEEEWEAEMARRER